jgi:hypothetical protein
MALITFAMLRHLNIAALEAAGHSWRAQAKTMAGIGDDLLDHGVGPLRKQPVVKGQWVHLAGVHEHDTATNTGTNRVYVMGDPDSCGGEMVEAAYAGS